MRINVSIEQHALTLYIRCCERCHGKVYKRLINSNLSNFKRTLRSVNRGRPAILVGRCS
jgi:hypothetical protein